MRPKYSLWIILAIGAGLRVLVACMLPERFLFPDSEDYHRIAMNFIEGKGLILFPYSIATRPPLYSMFLVVCYSLGLGIFGIRILQAILGSLWILLQYKIASTISQNQKLALLASLFVAIDPLLIGFDSLILTENLFVGLFLGLLYWVIRSGETFRKWLVAGLILGLGCLCRDALLGFAACLIVWIFSPLRQAIMKKQCYLRVIAFGIGAICIIAPWTYRNYTYTKHCILITSKGGQNLYEAFAPGATGGINIWQMELPPEVPKMWEVERDRYLARWTLSYLSQNPSVIWKLIPEKQKRFWNIGLNYQALANRHAIHYPIMAFTILIYLTGIIGLIKIIIEKKITQYSIILLGIVYFTILHCIFLGSVRYRVPIMPLLEILSANGILWIYTLFTDRTKTSKQNP